MDPTPESLKSNIHFWASNSILRIKHGKEIWDRAWTLSLTKINGGRSHLQTRARFWSWECEAFVAKVYSITLILMF